jgi:predicted phosphoserine aminotransferase
VFHRCKNIRMRDVFLTARPVYVGATSATGFMEMAIRNTPEGEILCLVNGGFSERFAKVAEACERRVERVVVPWGATFDLNVVESTLASKKFAAVTVAHSETSTGVLNPIQQLAEVTRSAGDVVLLVDAVSSMAGVPIETDKWGIDFMLTGSQKCFALPPGLAFGAAQPDILERAKTKHDRGIYFDFIEFEKNIIKNQTPNTPAVSLMYALEAQLKAIQAETIEKRCARHQEMADRTYRWVDGMREQGVKLGVLAPKGYRSPSVTTITVPEGWTGSHIASEVKARGFVIATGYGKLKDQTFRIGHMGDHTMEELEALLEALEDILIP